MSTYYSIVCDKCKEKVAFVCQNFPARWGWMGGADKEVPAFIEKHEECLEHLRIISEHDPRYDEYA